MAVVGHYTWGLFPRWVRITRASDRPILLRFKELVLLIFDSNLR